MLHSRNQVIHLLTILALALGLLAACGGPEPTPVVVVVTRAETPEPEVQVVTATFTPSPEIVPTDTPLPTVAPSDTPLPSPTAEAPAEPTFVPYEHPSGTFNLQIPEEGGYEETEEGLYFTYGDSLVMVLYGVPDVPLDSEAMDAAIPAILDDALIGQGLITSYDDLAVEHNEEARGAVASMTMTSDEIGDGEGVVVLWQVEHVLYITILLTPDYAQVEKVWEVAMDSLDVTPSGVPAPTAPPTATKKPKPKPTAKPTSPPPTSPPASNQGCYLFQNYINAELTVTFTAQDRQWSDSFTIPAMGTKEYCLDPGRYTYTIDAPPPWNSINGEITVNAGERLLWPIRGE